jgi:penicillin-binding protein 1A
MARQNRRGSGDSDNGSGGRSGVKGLFKKFFIWMGALGLLVLTFAFAAVWIEAQQLPDFDTMKTSQNGQTILVRARDGSELFAMGPSYGKWLSYQEIPSSMKAAIIATEDRRFRDHIGIDPIGVLRSLRPRAKGQMAAGQLDPDPAACPHDLPQQ